MSKLIKLSISPFSPSIESAYGLTIQPHVPCGSDFINLLINPNITDYIEKDGDENIQISNFTVSYHTEETKIIKLNFSDKNTQIIETENKPIEIKLMNIGTENIQGHNFQFFEILVSEIL
jgi:hypothetical protein